MNKRMLLTMLMLLTIATVAFATPLAFAGRNNQNGDNGKSLERGTGKVNEQEGCRPDEQSGSYTIDMAFSSEERAFIDGLLASLELQLTTEYWAGGPCCPSNQYDSTSGLPLPNQCCNPPDMGPVGVPGWCTWKSLRML
jgi:hypothetical protein